MLLIESGMPFSQKRWLAFSQGRQSFAQLSLTASPETIGTAALSQSAASDFGCPFMTTQPALPVDRLVAELAELLW